MTRPSHFSARKWAIGFRYCLHVNKVTASLRRYRSYSQSSTCTQRVCYIATLNLRTCWWSATVTWLLLTSEWASFWKATSARIQYAARCVFCSLPAFTNMATCETHACKQRNQYFFGCCCQAGWYSCHWTKGMFLHCKLCMLAPLHLLTFEWKREHFLDILIRNDMLQAIGTSMYTIDPFRW